MELQHSLLQTPGAGGHHPGKAGGGTRGFHPTSSPWQSRPAPTQARTSHRSTAGRGSLRSSTEYWLLLTQPRGPPSLVHIAVSPPRPSPQPEEAEHLQAAARQWLARRRSVWTPACAAGTGRGRRGQGWRRALGRGQPTPPASLNIATHNFS